MSYKYQDNTEDTNICADNRTSSYYTSKAYALAKIYSKSKDHYSKLFSKYLSPGSTILDIGCGSGKDMTDLLKSGFSVSGADSSIEMISEAVTKYPELKDTIILSALPDLSGFRDTFKGILCSAVLQHIPDADLYESFHRIRELTAEKGIFIVSFPVEYPGIDPETNRDADGRLFHLRPEEKYRFLIGRLGFSLIETFSTKDSLGREGVVWGTQIWKKGDMDVRE